jgi:hydrogenase maturation protease
MSTLVIGIGNTLRGDDGVGPFVVELLRAAHADGLELRTTATVLPELASEMPGHSRVVFVDADLEAHEVTLRSVAPPGNDGLHRFAPARVVEMARGLGFLGKAWLCSLPVQSMKPGEALSKRALLAADRAAALLLGRFAPPPGTDRPPLPAR